MPRDGRDTVKEVFLIVKEWQELLPKAKHALDKFSLRTFSKALTLALQTKKIKSLGLTCPVCGNCHNSHKIIIYIIACFAYIILEYLLIKLFHLKHCVHLLKTDKRTSPNMVVMEREGGRLDWMARVLLCRRIELKHQEYTVYIKSHVAKRTLSVLTITFCQRHNLVH